MDVAVERRRVDASGGIHGEIGIEGDAMAMGQDKGPIQAGDHVIRSHLRGDVLVEDQSPANRASAPDEACNEAQQDEGGTHDI